MNELVIGLLGNLIWLVLGAAGGWFWNNQRVRQLKQHTHVLAERLRRRNPVAIGNETAFQVQRRGVIFTLSTHSGKPGSVAKLVLQQLNPEYVGFLGSKETEMANAHEDLRLDAGIPDEKCMCEKMEPSEIVEGKTKSTLIIDWMLKKGLKPEEIVVDVTGGLTTLSLAAFMAAEEKQVDCQYIQSEYDRAKNQFMPGTQKPILITHYLGYGLELQSNDAEGVVVPGHS